MDHNQIESYTRSELQVAVEIKKMIQKCTTIVRHLKKSVMEHVCVSFSYKNVDFPQQKRFSHKTVLFQNKKKNLFPKSTFSPKKILLKRTVC